MTPELDLAELLHENAKSRMELGLPAGALPGGETFPLELMDGSLKTYPTRPSLPLPTGEVRLAVGRAIRQRESSREFAPEPLSLNLLAQLLFHGNGIREVSMMGPFRNYRRNNPTAGNLGSVDLYPIVLNVDGLERGVYHYDSLQHRLTPLRDGTALAEIDRVLMQPEFGAAAVIIAMGSSLARVRAKYGLRGYRFACIDCGHVGQNLCLVATALGLATCPGGGFDDDRLNELLDLDGRDESALYTVALGPRST